MMSTTPESSAAAGRDQAPALALALPITGSPPTNSKTTTKTTRTSTRSRNSQNLTFEKKNTNLLPIPRNYRIQKRPIPHSPAIASPYAGSQVSKVVYISSKTPFMGAVKRVLKLLRLAERRAMRPVIDEKQLRKQQHRQQHRQPQQGPSTTSGTAGEKAVVLLEQCRQKLRQDKVLVKATGRAIEKACAVGKWFEEGKGAAEDEYEVVVRTGSVCVVDDIVEDELDEDQVQAGEGTMDNDAMDETVDDGVDTKDDTEEAARKSTADITPTPESKNQRRRRRKRERLQQQRVDAFKDEDGEPPESRTRWVNMVEIAINIK